MQLFRFVSLFALALLVTFGACSCTDPDKELSNSLVGSWKNESGDLDIYSPDGTCTSISVDKGIFFDKTIYISMNWYIKDGYLHETVTSSNIPDKAPVGASVAGKVVSIDGTQFTFISAVSGDRVTEFRVKGNN